MGNGLKLDVRVNVVGGGGGEFAGLPGAVGKESPKNGGEIAAQREAVATLVTSLRSSWRSDLWRSDLYRCLVASLLFALFVILLSLVASLLVAL